MPKKEYDQYRQNRAMVIKKVRQSLKEFKAEQVILIMGKDEVVVPESGVIKHQYPMRIIEILNDGVYSKFMTALGQEILRLKALQGKGFPKINP